MRILHVLNHTGRLNGNVHAAVDLACGQALQGHSIAIASGGGDFDSMLNKNGVDVFIVNQRRTALNLVKASYKLTKIIKRQSIDIVHAHMATSAVLSYLACKSTGIPLVTTIHNEFERSAIAMGLGHRAIAVSSAVARSMERRGISSSRIRTVLNGTIGSPRFSNSFYPETSLKFPSILFVGGLHPRKGVLDLLKAFEITHAQIPDLELHILGEGPFEEEYKRFARALTCSAAIKFHGAKEDPRPWFEAADIFVLPSHAEPAALVISEACDAGCAIVASNVGGIPEMLNYGESGILFQPNDFAGLAHSLINLLNTPGALEKWKRRAKKNTIRLKLSRVVSEVFSVYQECFYNLQNSSSGKKTD